MTTDTLNEFHTKTLKLLKKLIGENREFDIIDLFSQMHPADIAYLIDILQDEEKVRLFSLLDIEKASDVILEISDASKDRIIEELSSEKLTKIIDEMDSDDAADFIAELPEEQAETVLAGIEPEDVEDVKKLLQYPEDTAGGIMQSELVSVPDTALIRDAVSAVIQAAEETEDIYSIFVVDAEGHLVGTVPLQQLITARRNSPVISSIERDIPRVTVDVDQEQVVQIFKKYDLVTLPVVDEDERLVGRITVDDVVDVMEEETSEDIYRIAGVGEDDSPLSGPVQSVRKRLPWLYFNLLTALCSALVIGFFEDTIKLVVALAVFMPVVAGLGGNAGGQTLALIVRGLALGELTLENARKTLFKELLVGVANGLAVGVVVGIVCYLWKGNFLLGGILFMAMTINILVGTLAGTLIPLTLKWLKLDPALGSNVFVTALTDVCGFLSFLGLATLFLKLLT